jgi:glycosyltransferase involved in cell wall biosynthesis
MMPLYFIGAVYNEEAEIGDLIDSVSDLVNGYRIVDDGSTDCTIEILESWKQSHKDFRYKQIEHTGLPETVKNSALQMVPDGSWCLMLDADERLDPKTKQGIIDFKNEKKDYDYVYFNQLEVIDGVLVRTFQKAKLFRKESIKFPLNNIHADDQFEGRGTYKEDWIVYHRKSTHKQIRRETEYLATYKKLLQDGKIDEGRYEWLIGLHHYVRPHG